MRFDLLFERRGKILKTLKTPVFLCAFVSTCMIVTLSVPAVAQNALTRLPSDTGRVLRGDEDFSGYVTPGMCEMAAWSMANRLNRATGRDTTSRASNFTDTVPAVAAAAAKKCLTKFSVATVRPEELHNFQQVALLSGNDTLAQSVLVRRLTIATTATDSALALRNAVEDLLLARPIRLAAARTTLDQLEGLGVRVGVQTLGAQREFLQVVRTKFDIAQIKRVATSMLSLADKLSVDDRDEMALVIKEAWLAKRDIAYWESPDSVAPTVARMNQDLSLLRNGRGLKGMFDREWEALDEFVLPQLSKPLKDLLGTPRYVYPASPSPELQVGQLPRGTAHLVFISNGQAPMMFMGVIKRLHQKYSSRGLNITFVLATLGYTHWNNSGVYTPSEEAESLREMLFDQLRLPTSLVVEELSVGNMPDGRKTYGPMQWHERTPALVLLIDRNGVLQMAFGQFTPEAAYEAYIERLLGKSGQDSVAVSRKEAQKF